MKFTLRPIASPILVISVLISLLYSPITLSAPGFQKTFDMSPENRLMNRARLSSKNIFKSGRFIDDPQMTQYLYAIVKKLYPKRAREFKISIYHDTDVNAFVFLNGHIVIYLGLIATAQSEAQLASVIAHEASHYFKKHVLKKSTNSKTIVTSNNGFLVRNNFLQMSEYSQELEIEADDMAYEQLVAMGYDTKEAAKMFEFMNFEQSLKAVNSDPLLNTHPSLQGRIDFYKQMSRDQKGYIGRYHYLEKTAKLREKYYQLNLSQFNYKRILFALKTNEDREKMVAHPYYFLGEAYRQRAYGDDIKKAEAAYLKALEALPDDELSDEVLSDSVPIAKALAVVYWKMKQYQKAILHLEQVLKHGEETIDIAYYKKLYDEAITKVSKK